MQRASGVVALANRTALNTSPVAKAWAACAGVLGFQNDGGFYLLHSTPNFPDDPAKDQYQGARASQGQLASMSSLDSSSRASIMQSCVLQSQGVHAYVTLRTRTSSESLPSAGINDCTAPKSGADPKCGPTHGQVEYGQSYLVRCI